MSAVIQRAKKHYFSALILEMLFILMGLATIFFVQSQWVSSVFAGVLAGFLPYCLLVYWYFFRPITKDQTKMTVLYWGEGLKWLATILIIGLSFKFITQLNVIAFFISYIILLIANNLFPFLLSWRKMN